MSKHRNVQEKGAQAAHTLMVTAHEAQLKRQRKLRGEANRGTRKDMTHRR